MHSISYSKQAEVDLESVIEYLLHYEEKIKLLRLNPHMGTECTNKLINRIFHSSVNYVNKLGI